MNKETGIILAVDIGTTSAKTLAVDASGRIYNSHAIGYPLNTPQPGYAEQDPDIISDAVMDTIVKVMTDGGWKREDIICVTFSSANHSLILLDEGGGLLTPSITWADQRSAIQAQRLMENGTGVSIYSRTGTPIHPMSPLVKLIWMKENRPELFDAAHLIIGIKEYVWIKLFGYALMDYSLASATGLFNLEKLDWDAEALQVAAIRAEQLPRLVPTTEVVRGLLPGAAARMGLNVDTPFVLGAQDGVLANLGIGAVEDGVMAVTIGTSSAARMSVKQPTFDAQGRLFCYALAKEHWLVGGPSNNGAIVLQWISERLFPGKRAEDIIPLAAEVPAGANGLLFMPLLSGERAPFWDGEAKGVMFGLTLAHKETHMLRAALEGVIFQIAAIVDLMKKAGEAPQEIRASGGFARSPLWCQIMADMLGMPVSIPESVESSALGAAQLGLYAVEGCEGELLRWKDGGAVVYEPNMANAERYQSLLPIYLSLYEQLKGQMRDITRLEAWETAGSN
ncbi:gluconokinase [Paenibacillus sp. HB172176]|uniref:gluconokinase n=1 Tax=Paenibacillus sp. HB172176 TaxID=2493690 RepID=UPI00143B1013|nr:gluconokinase [Paenibacillus sp. HB172176]